MSFGRALLAGVFCAASITVVMAQGVTTTGGGSVGCSQMPALTGAVTSSAGNCNNTLAAGQAVANLGYTPLRPSNNLSDVTAATARTNLGLGTIATQGANAVALTGGTITGVVTSKAYSFTVPNSGDTVTLATNTDIAIIAPAAGLALLTITLPVCNAGYDGVEARYSSTQAITGLTVNASGGSVADAPVTLGLGAGNGYLCRGANTTWYRIF